VLELLLVAVVAAVTFFASAIAIVGSLTWALVNIPGSPWPRLCRSRAVSAQAFTVTVVLLSYIVAPGLTAWWVGSAFSKWWVT
jgi:hypothetical protein